MKKLRTVFFFFLLFFEASERVLLFGAEFKRGPGEKKKALTCYLSHLCPSLLKNNARSHCRRRSSLSAVNKWADATLGGQMGRVFLFFIYSFLSFGPEVQTDHADRAAAAKSAATGG